MRHILVTVLTVVLLGDDMCIAKLTHTTYLDNSHPNVINGCLYSIVSLEFRLSYCITFTVACGFQGLNLSQEY